MRYNIGLLSDLSLSSFWSYRLLPQDFKGFKNVLFEDEEAVFTQM